MKKILFIALILTGIVFILTACSGSSSEATVIGTLEPVPAEYAGKTNPLDTNAVAAGEKTFNTNCVPCHGGQGHGDGPAGAALDPRPQNLAALQAVASDDYLFWRISMGRNGTAMIGWKDVLSEEQIWQLVAYIHTLK